MGLIPELDNGAVMLRNVIAAVLIAVCLGGPVLYVTSVASSEVNIHDKETAAHADQFKDIAEHTAEITANQREFRVKIQAIDKSLDEATEERKTILKAVQGLNDKLDRRWKRSL